MPREPVTIAKGTRPASRSRSPASRAAARTVGEARAGRGVEVEDQAVGLARLVGAREPDVRRDHVLAGEVDERRGVLGQDLGERAAPLGAPSTRAIQSGKCAGHRLHEEARARRCRSGKRLQRERTVADVGQHRRRHALVVAGEVELGDPRPSGTATLSGWLIRSRAGRPGSSSRSSLPHHLARGLVVAQAEEARMAQPAVAGPLGEADLRDQLGLDPGARRARGSRSRRRTAGRRARSGRSRAARSRSVARVEAGARPCRRSAARRRRSSRAAARRARSREPFGGGEAADDQLLALLALELQPVARARGRCRRCRRAWRSRPPSPCGRPRRTAPRRRALRCGVKRTPSPNVSASRSSALALAQRQRAHVVAVEPEHVEDVEEDRHAPRRPRRASRAKLVLRAVEGDDLAVDDEARRRLGGQRLGELGVAVVRATGRCARAAGRRRRRGSPRSGCRRACARRSSPGREKRSSVSTAFIAPASVGAGGGGPARAPPRPGRPARELIALALARRPRSIVRPLLTDSGCVLTGLRRASAPSSRRLMSSHCGLAPPPVRCSVQPPRSFCPSSQNDTCPAASASAIERSSSRLR